MSFEAKTSGTNPYVARQGYAQQSTESKQPGPLLQQRPVQQPPHDAAFQRYWNSQAHAQPPVQPPVQKTVVTTTTVVQQTVTTTGAAPKRAAVGHGHRPNQ